MNCGLFNAAIGFSSVLLDEWLGPISPRRFHEAS